MKHKKTTWIGAVLLLTLSLSGCTLAQKDAGEFNSGDTFSGVFVTVGEHAFDQYEEDTSFENGELVQPDIKIPGELTKEKGTVKLTFRDIPGYAIFTDREKDKETGEWTDSHYADPEIQDLHFGVNVKDGGQEYTAEGTLYCALDASNSTRLHQIYQKKDGSYYMLLSSRSSAIRFQADREGEMTSSTMTQSQTSTADKVSKTESVTMKIHVNSKVPVVQASLLEYGTDDRLLRRSDVPLSERTCELLPDTAYLIVEETKANGSVERSIYSWDQAAIENGLAHTLYLVGTNDILNPVNLELVKKLVPSATDLL